LAFGLTPWPLLNNLLAVLPDLLLFHDLVAPRYRGW
jgi:hypothetical protein